MARRELHFGEHSSVIRRAHSGDAPRLLALMRDLAQFEGYADRFAVTERELIERGLSANGAVQFFAWVAEEGDRLDGYAVTYLIPFTFDLRPTIVIKELYVDQRARGSGIGNALFTAAQMHARSINARLLRWQVLPNNDAAKRFYRRRGGGIDASWENWLLDLDLESADARG
jgi:ribosomal protein S18 acetylase RimI-like enzyme